MFIINHFKTLKNVWNAGRARARKGEAQKLLNGNNLKGIKNKPHIYIYVCIHVDMIIIIIIIIVIIIIMRVVVIHRLMGHVSMVIIEQ